MKSWLLLFVLLLACTASGCESLPQSTYGGRQVDVSLAVRTPTDGELQDSATQDVEAWVLNLVQWSNFKGRARFAAYEKQRAAHDPQAGEELAELVFELNQASRHTGVPPLQLLLPMELHYLIARFQDRFRYVEFNTTSERKVALGFGDTEG